MVSIIKGRALALALIFLIIANSAFQIITVACARSSNNIERQLVDCNSPIQSDISGCGSGGRGGGTPRGGRHRGSRSGPTPGSSRCQKGCAGNKFGDCICCK